MCVAFFSPFILFHVRLDVWVALQFLLERHNDVLLQTMSVAGIICHHCEVWQALMDVAFVNVVLL